MKKNERLLRLYELLSEAAAQEREFTTHEAIKRIGYKKSTIKTYLSKKLHSYVSQSNSNSDSYRIAAPLPKSEEAFLSLMTQRAKAPPTKEENLAASLLERSRDAFTVAIESYNRPSLHNRVEVFTILITNAWELLLKAEIINASDDTDAIFYEDSDRSLAIRDALKERIPKENNAVRKNLEKVCDLRDNAVHLLIPELQAHWSRLFQANVLNFITRYEDATGENLFNSGRGMLSLIVDREAAELATIKLKFGEASAETVESFLQRFLADEEELDTPNFAIPVDYRLVLTKANQQGDIVLSHGEGGRRAIKVVQSRNIDKTHPHLMMEAVELIGERLSEHHVTRPRVTAICEKHHIYNSPGSKYYDEIQKPFTRRFSDTFVDWVVEKASEDTEWIERAWDWYS